MTGLQKELDRLAIEELVRYAVPAEECEAALVLVRRCQTSRLATAVLRSYYQELPEGREERAVDMRLVGEQEGMSLVGLATAAHRYLYLYSSGDVVYLGPFERGIDDASVRTLFGYQTADEFHTRVPAFTDLPSLLDTPVDPAVSVCVACGVAVGALHAFGCPVELCPWCQGQLRHCNCRFDQLGVDTIDSDEQLDRFAALLDRKGRIPFSREQNPSYPSAGQDGGPAGPDKSGRPGTGDS